MVKNLILGILILISMLSIAYAFRQKRISEKTQRKSHEFAQLVKEINQNLKAKEDTIALIRGLANHQTEKLLQCHVELLNCK